jgi:hypothetical protein
MPGGHTFEVPNLRLGATAVRSYGVAQETQVTTTTINLTVSTIDSRNIPFFLQLWKRLGDINVFTDDIIQINSNPNLTGQHSGFCIRVRKPEIWLCRAGYILPPIPGLTPFDVNGGQLEARGLLNFNNAVNTVAITGGTGDYSRASGEILLNGNDFMLTVETP